MSLDITGYNDNVLPSISFAETEYVEGRYEPTGKSVLVQKEEWRGHKGYPVSDALVRFFEELLQTHPECSGLMKKYGISFRDSEDL